ncbi:hypothetical protein [Streptomyces sp. TRM64462]|uniref:hypothetical protein n=1 Tax=Streptomyces sp. TRM64462 TaxID=2741726 RepID=UPI0015868B03|nr:hypothetical protein [Streptomyces sp. TRM64462]
MPHAQPGPQQDAQGGYPGTYPGGRPGTYPNTQPGAPQGAQPATPQGAHGGGQQAGYPGPPQGGHPGPYPGGRPGGHAGVQQGGHPGVQPGGAPGPQPGSGSHPGMQQGSQPDSYPGGQPGAHAGMQQGGQPGAYPGGQPGAHGGAPGGHPGAQPGGHAGVPQGGQPGGPQGGAAGSQQGVPSPAGDPATQYLRPVPPAESPAESTQFLGTGFGGQQPPAQQPQPPAQQPQPPAQQPSVGSDAEATQYIPPVPGRSGPPAEFDNLFRDDSAGATQQMPRFDAAAPPPPYGQPQPQAYAPQYAEPDPYYDDEPEPRRRSPKLAIGAAVVVGCAVIGLGAGALMSGGDKADATDKAGAVTAVSATPTPAPTPSPSAEESADPAEAQAKELDKLLADSGNSRASVIRSVENIKQCRELDRAAADLRAAATQRRQLVTRLQGLTIDQLPQHTELSAALTEAWQASATADDHYAAWATQVKKPKNCKDGRARNTSRTAQAAAASGEATVAKQKAARLWNGIAETYGLTKRQTTQL